jgi:hypothetical protein
MEYKRLNGKYPDFVLTDVHSIQIKTNLVAVCNKMDFEVKNDKAKYSKTWTYELNAFAMVGRNSSWT